MHVVQVCSEKLVQFLDDALAVLLIEFRRKANFLLKEVNAVNVQNLVQVTQNHVVLKLISKAGKLLEVGIGGRQKIMLDMHKNLGFVDGKNVERTLLFSIKGVQIEDQVGWFVCVVVVAHMLYASELALDCPIVSDRHFLVATENKRNEETRE